jgi:hypothetical protein
LDSERNGHEPAGDGEGRCDGRFAWLRYAHVGIEWAALVAVACYVGFWADRRYDLFPWLTLCGATLGIGIGLYNFLKSVSRNA